MAKYSVQEVAGSFTDHCLAFIGLELLLCLFSIATISVF